MTQDRRQPAAALYGWLLAALLLFCLPANLHASNDYVVGLGDILDITVYDNPDLSTTVRVGGDGTIIMPLLGQITVAAKTVNNVARDLENRLADGYLVEPKVNVFIKEFRSQKAIILGQITKPGLYELQGSISLLELISMAGGLTKDAGDTATIKRKNEEAAGSPENVITINMKKLVEQGDTSLNISIVDGDSVYIVKAGVFFVTGQVNKPGSYKMEENTTVIKAITTAGGLTDRAAPTSVQIIRKIDGEKQVLEKVNMDAAIREDDVIVVPESFF